MALGNSRSVRRQGASRQARRQPIAWGRYLRGLAQGCKVLSIVAVLGAGGYFAVLGAQGWLDKPVTHVRIHGVFAHVGREQVAERIYAAMGDSFIKLDLGDIQAALSEEPWIDYARVERRWPDSLEVTVIEHKPIARWGARDVLNHRGEIIHLAEDEDASELLAGLPQLIAGEGREREMMAQYQALSRLLKTQKMAIKRLTCDSGRSWSMQLNDGVEIEMGREDVINRVRRFITVYDITLQQHWSQMQRVDLRYSNGLAVQWRDTASA